MWREISYDLRDFVPPGRGGAVYGWVSRSDLQDMWRSVLRDHGSLATCTSLEEAMAVVEMEHDRLEGADDFVDSREEVLRWRN